MYYYFLNEWLKRTLKYFLNKGAEISTTDEQTKHAFQTQMCYRTVFSLHNTHSDQQPENSPGLFVASSLPGTF